MSPSYNAIAVLLFQALLSLIAKGVRVDIDEDLSANETTRNRPGHVAEHGRLEGGFDSALQKHLGHKILLFGDSTTLYSAEDADPNGDGPGFGKLIQDRWQGKADVVCWGLSGYVSRWGQQALEKLVTKYSDLKDYAFAVLFWGTNDENRNRDSTPQQYEKALMAMGLRLVEFSGHELPLIIMGPPSPGEYKYGGYSPEVAAPYQEAAKRVVRRLSAVSNFVAYADLNEHIETPADFSDGIHFNTAGNLHAYETIVSVVDAKFPQLHPNQMPLKEESPPLKCPHLSERMFPTNTWDVTGGSRFPKWNEKLPGSDDEFAVESKRVWEMVPTGIP